MKDYTPSPEVKESLEYKVHEIPDEYIKAWKDKELKELEKAHANLSMTVANNRGIDSVDTELTEQLLKHLMVYIQYKVEYTSSKDDRDLLI